MNYQFYTSNQLEITVITFRICLLREKFKWRREHLTFFLFGSQREKEILKINLLYNTL